MEAVRIELLPKEYMSVAHVIFGWSSNCSGAAHKGDMFLSSAKHRALVRNQISKHIESLSDMQMCLLVSVALESKLTEILDNPKSDIFAINELPELVSSTFGLLISL